MYLPPPSAKTKLDLTNWARKEHFEFFHSFEEPYYGVCVTIDCTAAYHFVKARGISFFLYCLYQTLAASQQIEAFRYRIEQDEVFLYDRIDGGSVIDRSDGTFGYGFLPYSKSLDEFLDAAQHETARIRNTTGLPRTTANNIIRYSSLPLDRLHVSHARPRTLETRQLPAHHLRQDDRARWPAHDALIDPREPCIGGRPSTRPVSRTLSAAHGH